MRFLDSFLGGRGEKNIDEIGGKEHNNNKDAPETKEEQPDPFKELQQREVAMVEKHKRRKKMAAAGLLAISMLSSAPAYAQGEGAAALRGLFGLGNTITREVGSTARGGQRLEGQREREQTRRQQAELKRQMDETRQETERLKAELRRQEKEHHDDTALGRERVKAGTAVEREQTRRQQAELKRQIEEVHKDRDLGRARERTEQVKAREASEVQQEEIEETEHSRRDLGKQGVYEVGHKTEGKGAYPYSRERSGDAMSIDQMKGEGVETEDLPREERGALTEERRDDLAEQLVEDYKRGEPNPEFYSSFSEEEREFYGHRWNLMERTVEKTGKILTPDGVTGRE